MVVVPITTGMDAEEAQTEGNPNSIFLVPHFLPFRFLFAVLYFKFSVISAAP